MLKRALNILAGLLLLPFCAGFAWQLAVSLFTVAYKPGLPYYFLGGGLAYLAVHVLFRKPILAYVFGHELTHALFALLFGGSVKSFHASDRGGRVTVTKSNFVITLAPYFFPLYTVAALALYGLVIAAGAGAAAGWIVFAAGAAFCFHLVLTALFLRTDQSDIREHGAAFSYPLVFLFNVLFAALVLHLLLARDPGFLRFLADGIMKSIGIASAFVKKSEGVISRVL